MATARDAAGLPMLNADARDPRGSAAIVIRDARPGSFPPAARAVLIAKSESLIVLAEVDADAAGHAYAEVIGQAVTPFRHASTGLAIVAPEF